MKFTEVTREDIVKKNKKGKNKELKEELEKFIATGYQYAKVSDNYYNNNNNDLRRAIQNCIENHDLPIAVFMYGGITYVERL